MTAKIHRIIKSRSNLNFQPTYHNWNFQLISHNSASQMSYGVFVSKYFLENWLSLKESCLCKQHSFHSTLTVCVSNQFPCLLRNPMESHPCKQHSCHFILCVKSIPRPCNRNMFAVEQSTLKSIDPIIGWPRHFDKDYKTSSRRSDLFPPSRKLNLLEVSEWFSLMVFLRHWTARSM